MKNSPKYLLKGFLAILLISLLLFNSLGYIFIFLHLKKSFKEDILKKIHSLKPIDNTEQLVFSIQDIAFRKIPFRLIDKNEFMYKGNMYDILDVHTSKDSIYYTCLNDKNEDMIHNAFARYMTKNLSESESDSPAKNIYEMLILECLVYSNNFNFVDSFSSLEFFFSSNEYTLIYFEIHTPPPQFSYV